MNEDKRLEEPSRVTVLCPECQEIVLVRDIHAFLLGVHEQVCPELTALHAEA